MPPHVETPPPPVLSLSGLLVLLAACLGGSWFMVPRQDELMERLLKDKQYERVVAVLRQDAHGMSSTEIGALRHLSASQLTALSRLFNLTPREQLRAVFSPKSPPEYDAYVHHLVLAAVRYVDVVPPDEAYALIAPESRRVPERFRLPLLLTIARNAHAISRPDVAGHALSLATECAAAGWQVARDMAASYRWSGQPGLAARRLRAWYVTHRDVLSAPEQDEARELCISLALENSSPGEALDLCLHDLQQAASAGAVPRALLEMAVTLAQQSNRTKELLPWLQREIDAMPEASLPLSELRRIATADPPRLQPFIHWSRLFARWSDWNDQPDTAFTCHLRLAVLGVAESRDRCVEICDYLGRTEECCDMLLTLGELKEKPELTLLVARQLARLGRDDEAKVRFETWLEAHPDDWQAHFDVACLLEAMGDDASSRKAFEKMVGHFPQDATAKKYLAAACTRDGDYPAALALYGELSPSDHDHTTLENYAMIAGSLDDHAAELRALQLIARASTRPSPSLYLELAEAASYFPDTGQPLRFLREGLDRIPGSARLRIALALEHLHREEFEEALIALTHENLRHNEEAALAILSMSDSVSDAPRALKFLGADIETRFPLSPKNRLSLAVLHARAGQSADAERLFATVPETPESLVPIAEARFHAGHFREAARLMTAQLSSNPRGSVDHWVFLGDIYDELGQPHEARKAYDFSLGLLTADLPDKTMHGSAGSQ